MNVLKFPLVWAVALSGWTRLTGPLSVRGSIHRAHARAQCAGISPIVTAGHIQTHYLVTAPLVCTLLPALQARR